MVVHKAAKNRSMAAQKLLFPVGLLIFAAILIYVYCQSELHLVLPPKGNPNGPQRTLEHQSPLKAPHVSSDFRFLIKVLVYDRLESVIRCLESLSRADYSKDGVKLHIFVDHFGIEEQGIGGDVEGKLRNAHQILQYVDGFVWEHGEKEIHYRTQNAGLQAQWLEAWWPSSDHEFAFIVEDDMVLSPLFYRYLKALIATYYYDRENFNPMIYGASLQRPRFVGGKHGNKLKVDNDTRLFLYQMVGTWGQLLFPKPWKEFRFWYDIHKSRGIKPILQGMVTTGWYKRMGERIWTPWFIKFIHSHGYYNIYTNLLLERALSVSYRDAGVNYGKQIGPDSQLIKSSDALGINLWEMKPLKFMDWYNFCFQKVFIQRHVKNLDELGPVLSSVHQQKRVILVTLFDTPDAIVRNLLCQFDKLGIQSYILLGGKSSLLDDLSRRGNAVIYAEQLVDDMTTKGLVHDKFSSDLEMRKVLVHSYVIKKSLQLGYNIWIAEGSAIPREDIFSNPNYLKHDAILGEPKHPRTQLLYFKSSEETIQLFTKVFLRLMERTESSVINYLHEGEDILGFHLRSAIAGVNLRIKVIDASLMTQGGNNTTIAPSKTSPKPPPAKIFFWPRNKDADYVKEELKALNMWIIDDEQSCTSIFCHPS